MKIHRFWSRTFAENQQKLE